jgi:hypothetical protein
VQGKPAPFDKEIARQADAAGAVELDKFETHNFKKISQPKLFAQISGTAPGNIVLSFNTAFRYHLETEDGIAHYVFLQDRQ